VRLAPLASLGLVAALASAACAAAPTGAARAQNAAQELNLNARFGRMELAMESVAPGHREAFAERRRSWGSRVRIADAELSGFRLAGKEDALVSVRVSWYLLDEQELRTTTLRQAWHDHRGDWLLEREERLDGDIGLLGEPIPRAEPSEPRPPAQFPTMRLGTNN